LPQGSVLVGDAGGVEGLLHIQHGLLGRLQYGVEAADDDHRQDDIAVLAAHVDISQDVVSDAPDEVGDPVQVVVAHAAVLGSSKASEMYLRKMRPRTTCLYAAASMLLRSLSAESQSFASKPKGASLIEIETEEF
jgi:hypothetical protein